MAVQTPDKTLRDFLLEAWYQGRLESDAFALLWQLPNDLLWQFLLMDFGTGMERG